MSEQDRARLYDWLREQAGEEAAEYLMSCIASVPLTELATKDSVEATKDSVEAVKDSVERLEKRFDAELPKLATKDSVEALKDSVQRLETVCAGLDAKFEAERVKRDGQREADRLEVKHQFRWIVGFGVTILGVIVGFGIFS